MKKLKLDLNNLSVESFVAGQAAGVGTVQGQMTIQGPGACFSFDSVWDLGCDPYGATDEPNTCQGSCGDRNTCYATCAIDTCGNPSCGTCTCPDTTAC